MLIGTNLTYANSYNKRIIMETIRLYGPLSRVDIARKTQLTAQTVTNITKNLMKAGLIVEDSRQSSGPGAPSILLKLNDKAGYSVGIDFDKDHLTAVLIDFNGRICRKKSLDLDYPSPDDAVEMMSSTVFEMIGRHGIDRDLVWGVGVGLPGPLAINEQGDVTRVVNPEAFPGWVNVPIAAMLEQKLQMPLLIENNASAAAIGEHWYGDGKHLKSFFYIYFGAGLGGGIVIDGQLYSGHTSNAGELGYFPMSAFAEPALELDHDHLGEFFNIPRLQKKLQKSGHIASSIKDLKLLHSQNIPELTDWLDDGSKSLVPLILGIEYMLDPEAIFFGGRLPETMLLELVDKIKQLRPVHRITRKTKRPQYHIASAGIDAAALGVASLPLYASFAPQHKLLMRQKVYTGQIRVASSAKGEFM